MLEIVVLIFLARSIGRQAKEKGLRASTWQIYLVAGWILMEIIGIFAGVLIFGMGNLVSVILLGLAFAFASYFSLRTILDRYPNYLENDIDQIGEND